MPNQQNPYWLQKIGQGYVNWPAGTPGAAEKIKLGQSYLEQAQKLFGAQTIYGKPVGTVAPDVISDQQKELWKTHNAIPEQLTEIDQTDQRLGRITDIIKGGYQTGAFATEKANIIADLRGLGINVPSTATANPEALQVFMKEQKQLIMSQVKAMGGRILASEIKTFGMGNPGPEMQPKANAMMLTEMRGVLQWERQYKSDFMNWHEKNPGAYDEGQFASQWLKANPIQKFIDPEVLNFAYPGQEIPKAPKDRMPGQLYMLPSGKLGRAGADGKLVQESD